MPRTKIFLRTRDIDWAVKIGDIYIHASSAGDDLPEIVDRNLTQIWDALKASPVLYTEEQVQLNDAVLNEKFPIEQMADHEDYLLKREWYVHSFRAMAMRGFYSFDRDIKTPIGDSTYHLIASPSTGGNNIHIDLPWVNTHLTIDELKSCRLVELINRFSHIED